MGIEAKAFTEGLAIEVAKKKTAGKHRGEEIAGIKSEPNVPYLVVKATPSDKANGFAESRSVLLAFPEDTQKDKLYQAAVDYFGRCSQGVRITHPFDGPVSAWRVEVELESGIVETYAAIATGSVARVVQI